MGAVEVRCGCCGGAVWVLWRCGVGAVEVWVLWRCGCSAVGAPLKSLICSCSAPDQPHVIAPEGAHGDADDDTEDADRHHNVVVYEKVLEALPQTDGLGLACPPMCDVMRATHRGPRRRARVSAGGWVGQDG